MPFPKIYCVILSILLASSYAIAEDPLLVRVPVKSVDNERHSYPVDLLTFLLNASDRPYKIQFSKQGITTQSRDIKRLINNKDIDIGWFGTSIYLEETLYPIRFPIWRGLLGYRIFIINKDRKEEFSKVASLMDLQQFVGNQGIGWTDIEILENSGLKQEESKYDVIFRMISNNRTDYFSRGIGEAFREISVQKTEHPNLMVEQSILLKYPFAGYFFTNKNNLELANLLENSFEKTYKDGSFLEFFYNHWVVKDMLEKVDLDNRTFIEIPNPLLTKETKNLPEWVWH